MARAVEDWIAHVNAQGWRVNNLFQLPQGGWQANLRTDPSDGTADCFSWGKADTPFEALERAAEKAGIEEKIAREAAELLE